MRVDGKTTQSNVPEVKINQVIILDASGSMASLDKYTHATKGVLDELELCKQLGYTFSLVEMVQKGKVIIQSLKADPNKVTIDFNGATGKDTPLYDTIVSIFTNLLFGQKDKEKYLIKIWTDGQDNASLHGPDTVKQIVKQMEDVGGTVTFICTTNDLSAVQRMGIDKSNIITYNNTGEDLEKKMKETRSATVNYSKRVAAGEDVTRGFYSKSIVND